MTRKKILSIIETIPEAKNYYIVEEKDGYYIRQHNLFVEVGPFTFLNTALYEIVNMARNERSKENIVWDGGKIWK